MKNDMIIFAILSESEYNLEKLIEPYKDSDKELIVLTNFRLTTKELDYLDSIMQYRLEKEAPLLIFKEFNQDSITDGLDMYYHRFLHNLRKGNQLELTILSNDYSRLDDYIYFNF